MTKNHLIYNDETFDQRIGPGYADNPQKVRLLAFMALRGLVDMSYLHNRSFQPDTPQDEARRLGSIQWLVHDQSSATDSIFAQAQREADKIAEELEYEAAENDLAELLSQIGSLNDAEAATKIADYLKKYGFSSRMFIDPSPLFPEGREQILNFSNDEPSGNAMSYKKHVESRAGFVLDEDVRSVFMQHLPFQGYEETPDYIEDLREVSLETLRTTYGAKAANLIHLARELNGDESVYGAPIPPFIPVSTDLYHAWKARERETFIEQVEVRREQALELLSGFRNHEGLVAIRSSAVRSEDGRGMTGAGLYNSVVVSPKNPAAFTEAIEKVYGSTDSPAASEYRESHDISDESMGLVIQCYVEGSGSGGVSLYGYGESSANNDRLVVLTTQHGPLVYDKATVAQNSGDDLNDLKRWLHTHPDHDKPLGSKYVGLYELPLHLVRAEEIFGSPVQIEFADRYIVQVRPINIDTETSIEFPDEEPILTLFSNTVGDVTLPLLDPYQDNREKRGLVLVQKEYAFTDYWNNPDADHVIPKEGAVIIGIPHTNGHVQTLCREKGLLCLYPRVDSDMLGQIQDATSGSSELRIVCDGYEGRVYSVK